jgi:hypothetical protein
VARPAKGVRADIEEMDPAGEEQWGGSRQRWGVGVGVGVGSGRRGRGAGIGRGAAPGWLTAG